MRAGERCIGRAAVLGVVLLVAFLFPSAAPAALYNQARDCLNANQPGEVIPAAEGSPYEIHLHGSGVPRQKGVNLQADLAARDVANRLTSALGGISPRGYPPRRLPLFVTSKQFDADGNEGVMAPTCADPNVSAVAVRANMPRQEIASTGAHELFHAFSDNVPPPGRVIETWWEEASASYAEWKLGFAEPNGWNQWLKRPELPLDSTQGSHEYAMWRFIRMLDARGQIGGDAGEWSLIRETLPGSSTPGPTPALGQQLAARGTTIGDELAAFWGDRILRQPTTGAASSRPNDAQPGRIKPGRRTIETSARPLGTWFSRFRVAPNVARVEFEFEPRKATEGIFFGAPTDDDSQRFASGETIAFCTEAATDTELHLPARGFPVTFTNGATSGGRLRSEIDVFAQRDADQCRNPALVNRACLILDGARVQGIFGAGGFPFFTQESDTWHCVFVNNEETRGVDLVINRVDRDENLAKLRRGLRKALKEAGYTLIAEGDVAGMQAIYSEETMETTYVILMLVGRDLNAISVDGSELDAATLAHRIAGIEE
jgi:hypothetical protein